MYPQIIIYDTSRLVLRTTSERVELSQKNVTNALSHVYHRKLYLRLENVITFCYYFFHALNEKSPSYLMGVD